MAIAHKAKFQVFGYAVGVAGNDSGTSFAPIWLRKSAFFEPLADQLDWQNIYYITQSSPQLAALPAITSVCEQLAEGICSTVKRKRPFLVLGGDHSSAIGTWSGASEALANQGDLGLIWMDAHLDSHTSKTTPSGNIHGMSLAALLGHGNHHLTHILGPHKKLKPENVCVVGPRSYETEELQLLKKLGVKIYFDAEVHKRGLKTVFKEAIEVVSERTVGFGISLDLDLFDPQDAPGVGVPEPRGVSKEEFLSCCRTVARHSGFIGLEIVEFNPLLDKTEKTEKLIAQVLKNLIL